jgi:hypothetical protein
MPREPRVAARTARQDHACLHRNLTAGAYC